MNYVEKFIFLWYNIILDYYITSGVRCLQLQNSYIFLENTYKKAVPKETKEPDGTIRLVTPKDVRSFVLASFPNLNKNENNSNRYRQEYHCSITIEPNTCNATFLINKVADITYLDVLVDGKLATHIVKCLEYIQNTLFSSEIRKYFIDIISYDAVSEYFCNKIYPKLNTLERNLRKLLFNIYSVKFGNSYFQATISTTIQDKAKKLINEDTKATRSETKKLYNAQSNEEAKTIDYIRQFFYSLELGDIKEWLFTETCNEYDKEAREAFLKKHKDLSQLSDNELRTAFQNLSPKSDWERFFSYKIQLENAKDILDQIRLFRNKVAHAKFFYRTDYENCNKLISDMNKAVIKAIQITEEEDFAKKNNEHIAKSISSVLEQVGDISKKLAIAFAYASQWSEKVGSVMVQAFEKYQKYDLSPLIKGLQLLSTYFEPAQTDALEEPTTIEEPEEDTSTESEDEDNAEPITT